MPAVKNHFTIEVARRFRAYLDVDVGLVRASGREAVNGRRGRQKSLPAEKRPGWRERVRKLKAPKTVASKVRRPARASMSKRRKGQTRLAVFRGLLEPMKPGRLLDLGCGHGKFSVIAHELGWEVTAVDARDARMPMTPGIKWVRSDVREFEIEGYDCVSVLGLFYHLTLDDQLDLLRRCAGAKMILDTHVALEPTHEERGYQGHFHAEGPGMTREQLDAKVTASWGNQYSFWPTEESLIRMIQDSGFSSVFKLEPPYTPDRTFYLCL